MKKKISVAVFLILFVTGILSGCGKKEEDIEPQPQEEEQKIQIGMSFDSFVIERWQRDRDVFVSTAKELGAEVNVQNANGDVGEQIEQIQYFIDKKMDVIVVVCIDSDSLSGMIQKAKNAGMRFSQAASL